MPNTAATETEARASSLFIASPRRVPTAHSLAAPRNMESPTKKLLPSLGGTLGFGVPQEDPFCVVCNKRFATLTLYDSHLAGHTHRDKLCRMCPGGMQPGGGLHPSMTDKISELLAPVQPRHT